MVEPSGMLETASAAVAMVLFNFMASQSPNIVHGRQAPERFDLHHEENDRHGAVRDLGEPDRRDQAEPQKQEQIRPSAQSR